MSEFAGDEVAAALVLTGQAAVTCLDLALDLAIRLPGTARALRAGVIDYLKARIIAEATRILTDADARAVEERVLPEAGGQTSGKLRVALARAVLAVDPEAAARRREQAGKDPRVRRWREDAGTAALAGYSLPAAAVLEADQAITTRALDLRAAGVGGTLEELRARAYLDALLGRDSAVAGQPVPGPDCDPGSPGQSPAAGPSGPAGGDAAGGDAAGAGPDSGEPAPEADGPADHTDGDGDGDDDGRPYGDGAGDQPAPGPANGHLRSAGTRAGDGGRVAARVNLTVPLTTLLDLANAPGEVGGFGPVDAALARRLGRAAGAHPATRWCLTVTDEHGQAIGHGCLPGRRPGEVFALGGQPSSGPGDRPGAGSGGRSPDCQPGGGPATMPGRPGPPGRAGPSGFLARDLTVTITALARGSCDHRNEEPGYEPSRRLRHLVRARTATCSAPGCARPAPQCDLDHTVPYDQGGRTCECNLAPLCRHHHRCKQAEGWRLEQPEPGVVCWTTPAGRHYITTPTTYPG
jgi:hypothetical protein